MEKRRVPRKPMRFTGRGKKRRGERGGQEKKAAELLSDLKKQNYRYIIEKREKKRLMERRMGKRNPTGVPQQTDKPSFL